MKFTYVVALTAALFGSQASASESPKMADFAPFGVTQFSDIDAIGCEVYDGTTYECSKVPVQNKAFSVYMATVKSGVKAGICKVVAYTQIFEEDASGFQASKAFESIRGKLMTKYGDDHTLVNAISVPQTSRLIANDAFAASIKAGVRELTATWSGEDDHSAIPKQTEIELRTLALSDERTFVALSYYFGGPGCTKSVDEGMEGL